ncbi:transferase family-domain-containing protein [Thermothelomyces heterothallicus CBS 202.75]|uniref:transferase family-domain-containing protein n=1 Tax=Thermothelomyces heterothallicus CBS 202.75 TaxID=1149848 RepID=UPI003742BDE9
MAPPRVTKVPLTPIDHLHRPNYIKICYWFPLQPDVDPKDVYNYLGQGLRKMFSRMPWLGGKVYLQEPNTPGWRPGQREIRYEPWDAEGPVPHQLVYKELDTELTYADWKNEGFPPEAFPDEELLDVPVEGDMEAGCDIFVAQTSFVPGGVILCMSTCHAAVDGTGMVIAMKAWADNCRSLHDASAEQDDFPPETYDRGLPDRLWEEEAGAPVPENPDGWTRGLVGLEGPRTAADDPAELAYRDRKAVHRSFYIPAAKLAELQKICDESGEPAESGAAALSTSDVITALMWRAHLRARAAVARDGEPLPDRTVLEGAVNGRLDFSASLPPLYLGNLTFYNQAVLPTADVLDPDVPLSRLARAVRKGAARANAASLNQAYGLLRTAPTFGLVRPRFRRVHGFDLLISNLLAFPVDDILFGAGFFANAGRAEALRAYLGRFGHHARCSLVLPKRPAGVEISMNLFEDEMEHLEKDEAWTKYCMPL